MSNRAAVMLSSCALALALVALGLAATDRSGVASPPTPTSEAYDDGALTARIEALEQRLPVAAPAVGGDERTAATPPALEPVQAATEQRLAALEAAVAALRPGFANLGSLPDTVAGIREALADKNLYGPDTSASQTQRRRELWTRFLELAPRDPGAAAILRRYCDDLLVEDPRESLALLDRHRLSVDLPALEAERMRANALEQMGDFDGGRAIHARIAADRSLSEEQRVDAAFWHAHAWKEQGRYDEARREFAALVAHYGNAAGPALASLVAGARNQIEEIDRWQKRR